MWWKDLVKILGPCEYSVENYAKAIEIVYDSWVELGSFSKVANLYGISNNTVHKLVNLAMDETQGLKKGFGGFLNPKRLLRITGSSAITKENEEKAIRMVYERWAKSGSYKEVADLFGISEYAVEVIVNCAMDKQCALSGHFDGSLKRTPLQKITGSSAMTKANEERAIRKVYDLYREYGTLTAVGKRVGLRSGLISEILEHGKKTKVIPEFKKPRLHMIFEGIIKPKDIEKITGSSAMTKENEENAIRNIYELCQEYGTLTAVGQRLRLRPVVVSTILEHGIKTKLVPEFEKSRLQRIFTGMIYPKHVEKITGSSAMTKENEEKAIKKVYELYVEYGTFKEVGERLGLRAGLVSIIFKQGVNIGIIPKSKKAGEKLNNKKKGKFLMIQSLYNQLGTLEAVGRRLGLSRQRVHQILIEGEKIGLFKTVPSSKDSKFKSKEETLHDYNAVVALLGMHPTTTILNGKEEWRKLLYGIKKWWGSLVNFRQAYNIPSPSVLGSQKTDIITLHIKAKGESVEIIEMMEILKSGYDNTRRFLNYLVKEGVLIKTKVGKCNYYNLR